MARTKRKINPILPVAALEKAPQRIYQAGGYVRLSVEDSGRPGADTIETQREPPHRPASPPATPSL